MAEIGEIEPVELKERLAHGDALTILDVREPEEIEIAAFPGAMHIPMGDIPSRLAELDPDAELVVVCHHGMRSAQVAMYLATDGIRARVQSERRHRRVVTDGRPVDAALLKSVAPKHARGAQTMTTHLAAAIQMATTSDKAANLEKAEHLIRLAAARGARLVALPEVFNWRGKRAEEAAAAESARRRDAHPDGRAGARTRNSSAGRFDHRSMRPASAKRYNTSVLIRPRRRAARASIARSICSTSIFPAASRSRSPTRRLPGAEVVTAATALGTDRAQRVLRPALPRTLSPAGVCRRANSDDSERVHLSDRRGALGGADSRPRDRKPMLRDRAGAIWPQRSWLQRLRQFDDRRSMGPRAGAGRRQEGVVIAPIDLEYLERVRRELPSLAHARLR